MEKYIDLEVIEIKDNKVPVYNVDDGSISYIKLNKYLPWPNNDKDSKEKENYGLEENN